MIMHIAAGAPAFLLRAAFVIVSLWGVAQDAYGTVHAFAMCSVCIVMRMRRLQLRQLLLCRVTASCCCVRACVRRIVCVRCALKPPPLRCRRVRVVNKGAFIHDQCEDANAATGCATSAYRRVHSEWRFAAWPCTERCVTKMQQAHKMRTATTRRTHKSHHAPHGAEPPR
jgi:hypothetical protein